MRKRSRERIYGVVYRAVPGSTAMQVSDTLLSAKNIHITFLLSIIYNMCMFCKWILLIFIHFTFLHPCVYNVIYEKFY